MSSDPALWLIAAGAGLAALVITAQASLRGWQGWLDLRRAELDARYAGSAPPTPASRIDVADLKERVRKLEAIAAGLDY